MANLVVDRGQFQVLGHQGQLPIEAHRRLTVPASFFTTTAALLGSELFVKRR